MRTKLMMASMTVLAGVLIGTAGAQNVPPVYPPGTEPVAQPDPVYGIVCSSPRPLWGNHEMPALGTWLWKDAAQWNNADRFSGWQEFPKPMTSSTICSAAIALNVVVTPGGTPKDVVHFLYGPPAVGGNGAIDTPDEYLFVGEPAVPDNNGGRWYRVYYVWKQNDTTNGYGINQSLVGSTSAELYNDVYVFNYASVLGN